MGSKHFWDLPFVPTAIVTDRYRAYDTALRDLGLSHVHIQGKRLNNRAESSHVPIRRREHKMQGFRSAGPAQHFLSGHAAAYNTFSVCRHLTTASTYRTLREQARAAGEALRPCRPELVNSAQSPAHHHQRDRPERRIHTAPHGAENGRCSGSSRWGRREPFVSAHAFIHGYFHPRHHLLTAGAYRAIRSIGFVVRHLEACARHTA